MRSGIRGARVRRARRDLDGRPYHRLRSPLRRSAAVRAVARGRGLEARATRGPPGWRAPAERRDAPRSPARRERRPADRDRAQCRGSAGGVGRLREHPRRRADGGAGDRQRRRDGAAGEAGEGVAGPEGGSVSHLAKLVAQAVADAREREKQPLPLEAPPLRPFPRAGLIAEVKRASPSRGAINPGLDPARLAQAYALGGASAISVLTDRVHFGGSLDDLRVARAAAPLPVLRKDFIVTEFQVREARAYGADAVLLIAAAAPLATLRPLRQLARELGMAVLFEVHEESELDAARACEPDLLGVNARNLKTLEVHPDAFARVAPLAREIAPLVAESGVRTPEDARRLRALGASMLLVGEALSSAADPQSATRRLVQA
ncbi:MAG: hypothetical protein E6J65_11845 [Deltaproteobacteria bacterium]|nr:MAG: hypothetical protein E6J65_11845 [Deltaproteobacteria bacterium]